MRFADEAPVAPAQPPDDQARLGDWARLNGIHGARLLVLQEAAALGTSRHGERAPATLPVAPPCHAPWVTLVTPLRHGPPAAYLDLLELVHARRDQLLAFTGFLERETVYFTAPASTRYHLNVEGGLVQHSVNVATVLLQLRTKTQEVVRAKIHFSLPTIVLLLLFSLQNG